MKTASRKLGFLVSASAVIALITASSAFAIEGNNNTTKQTVQATICSRVASLKTKSDTQASGKVETLQANFQKRLTKIATDQKTIDAKIATARQDKKARFEAHIQNMLNKPDLTAEQKTAIETFRTSVQEAETKREQAVDAARTTFREGVKLAVATNQQKLLTVATTYHQAVLDAFNLAAVNCTSEDALTTLKNSVKSARETLTKSRESSNIGQTIKQLAQTRTEAIKKVNDEFKTSVNEYAQILADALGASSESDQSNQ